MAQTDTRPGFKLPWMPERSDSDQPAPETAAETTVTDGPARAEELVTPDMIDTTAPPSTTSTTDAPDAAGARRPTKFMAELSRAMQVAAESSRDETIARLTAEAKAVVEEINAASTVESAALRRRADDDVAAVREWSKGEIARIREETEGRIALRKTALDGEIDAHALVVEARVERIGATIAGYEARMVAFFERLKGEEDPTRIATMAETMPDPPDLAAVAASIAEPNVQPFDPNASGLGSWLTPEPSVEADAGTDAQTVEPDAPTPEPAVAETTDAPEAADVDPTDAPNAPETVAADPSESDYAAAEAEAAAFTGDPDEDDGSTGVPDSADRVVATPITPDDVIGERATTRVLVSGLVSVASIATFKRSLGRVPGVLSIGVASGPDGEFVFTVKHDPGFGLADAITALAGFEARINAQSAGEIEVTAHDPDAGD
jgi:hypothetical protein